MANPVQIILNPENFNERREAGGGGSRRDFFAKRDTEFKLHKHHLISQLHAIASGLESAQLTDIGYVKVILRKDAWAKSHRPQNALFKPSVTPTVGGGDLGVMIIEASPSSLLSVADILGRAEDETLWRYDESQDRNVPFPTPIRSEAGAIERIELFGDRDRRDFSLRDAIEWLSDPATGGSYEVELFDTPPPHGTMDSLTDSRRRMFQSFRDGLNALEHGLTVERRTTPARSHAMLSVRIHQSDATPNVRLNPSRRFASRRDIAPFDPSEERHRNLLRFLDTHPLVRSISLPGIVARSTGESVRTFPVAPTLPQRKAGVSYPRIGIIDGGLDPTLSNWIIGQWGFLSSADRELSHGTSIGGLAVAGRLLNGVSCCPEPDGAELVDIDVLPDDTSNSFVMYYPGGTSQLFDEIEAAISDVTNQHDVRIFNMSINLKRPAELGSYDRYTARLDDIAEENDAIIFLSAGNIDAGYYRPEWPRNETQALANLAVATDDRLYAPAQSIKNVSVAALNPPGLPTSIPYAPACYSRRGPGLRTGVKPDLAHVGGSGTPAPGLESGLYSVFPGGEVTSIQGTSYATPLVAKTAAVLESAIEGRVSRETLLALLIHHSQIPRPLQSKPLISVARDLVGFGMPMSAERTLETDDHSITMVFASRIRPRQQVVFQFAWPASLARPDGRCRGGARLTLVSTPPLDTKFGSEFVRVNVNASLQQQKPDGKWIGRLDPVYLPGKGEAPVVEAELIKHGLKWSPVKVFAKTMPRGVGNSSNWRLFVEYLTRSNEEMPELGVPFTAILTISDPDRQQPVFNDLRQSLLAYGVEIADIRTAARITQRI